ncbi:hypothetical protein GCM10019017_72360 [Streptomyces showdoensis]
MALTTALHVLSFLTLLDIPPQSPDPNPLVSYIYPLECGDHRPPVPQVPGTPGIPDKE